MKREFLLVTARGRTAWIILILALFALPTSAAFAARTDLHESHPASPIVKTTEGGQIPDWEEPLDSNFLGENDVPAPVTFDPFNGAIEQSKIQDPKSDSAEATNSNEIDDSTSWPKSTTVKVIATWPSADTTDCSGVLVADNTILTAGHCVFTYNTSLCASEEPCWVANLQIFIHYGTQDEEESGYTKILTWTAWTENRDYAYDLAGVRLKQAFGNKVGWLGYGYNKEDENQFFLNNTFKHSSYSGGSFSEWGGLITKIEDHQLYSEDPSDYGQSGAGVYQNDNDLIVYGVLSHHKEFMLNSESTIHTAYTRITAHKFSALSDWIKGFMDDPDFNIYLPIFAN